MEWVIRYDLGDIVSSKYGTLIDIKGELPLPAGSTYQIPSLAKDQKRVDAMGSALAEKFKAYYPGCSETNRRQRSIVATLFSVYQNPLLNWEDEETYAPLLEHMVIAFALDDAVDNVLKIQDGVANYKIFLSIMNSFLKPGNSIDNFFPTDDENPDSPLSHLALLMEAYTKILSKLSKSAWDPSSAKAWYDEAQSSSVAHYVTFTAQSPNHPANFSHRSYGRQIAQHIHGMRQFLEIAAMATPGVKVSEEIRSTLLFKMLLDSVGNGLALINAIVGLKKDIAEDTWGDTPLLRDVVERGWTLQESFDNTVEAFNAEVRDINLALEILHDAYEGVEGVPEYLELVEHVFTGTCLTYAHDCCRSRYPETSLEAIQRPVSTDATPKASDSEVTKDMIKLEGINGMYFAFDVNSKAGKLIVGNSQPVRRKSSLALATNRCL